MESWPASTIVAVAGAAGGIVLGLAARLGRFCTLAAIEDAMYGGNTRRLRMWALAMAVAIIGVALSAQFGAINLSKTLYHGLPFNPLAWVLGGVLFGVGMAFCGTCAFGTLVRIGGGDLRALFVSLILAISAYMAVAGPTAELRLSLLNPLAIGGDDFPRTLVQLTPYLAPLTWPIVIAVALVAWSISSATFRRSRRLIGWSVAAGLTILAGWLSTAILGADPFDPQPVASHTYSVPLGQTLLFVMAMSSTSLTFGIGATLGVVVGAFLGATIRREFRWEAADDAHEMRRHLVGAFLMGTGGVFAGGCTIGQGLSAASVLALSTPVVLISIWVGVWLGLTYLMEGSVIGAVRHFARR
ncbi:MAG: YeeE/YedE family protein [Hyphomicrobiaceae bacterium]|nr:YeeE/YedE family protein [Hyphomicrobiaceae bacterium]